MLTLFTSADSLANSTRLTLDVTAPNVLTSTPLLLDHCLCPVTTIAAKIFTASFSTTFLGVTYSSLGSVRSFSYVFDAVLWRIYQCYKISCRVALSAPFGLQDSLIAICLVFFVFVDDQNTFLVSFSQVLCNFYEITQATKANLGLAGPWNSKTLADYLHFIAHSLEMKEILISTVY